MSLRERLTLFTVLGVVVASCSPTRVVRVGEESEEPGVVRHEIDVAKDVQPRANSKIAQDDSQLSQIDHP